MATILRKRDKTDRNKMALVIILGSNECVDVKLRPECVQNDFLLLLCDVKCIKGYVARQRCSYLHIGAVVGFESEQCTNLILHIYNVT